MYINLKCSNWYTEWVMLTSFVFVDDVCTLSYIRSKKALIRTENLWLRSKDTYVRECAGDRRRAAHQRYLGESSIPSSQHWLIFEFTLIHCCTVLIWFVRPPKCETDMPPALALSLVSTLWNDTQLGFLSFPFLCIIFLINEESVGPKPGHEYLAPNTVIVRGIYPIHGHCRQSVRPR